MKLYCDRAGLSLYPVNKAHSCGACNSTGRHLKFKTFQNFAKANTPTVFFLH